MKTLLLLAAVVGALTGCMMPPHGYGHEHDRSSHGEMGDRDMHHDRGRDGRHDQGGMRSGPDGDAGRGGSY